MANTSSGAAQTALIPPFGLFRPSWLPKAGTRGQGYTHLSKVIFTSTTSATHLLTLMRPFNYTTFSADAAASQAVLNIDADPGLYATKWRYQDFANATGAGIATARVADNAIAANDYVVYQCADGTWIQDTVSSVSTLAITMTNNVPTGGVKKGGLFYFFGVVTDSDPNTGVLNPQTLIAGSATRDASWADPALGVAASLHEGDPMILYDPTTSTGYGVIEACCGYYAGF